VSLLRSKVLLAMPHDPVFNILKRTFGEGQVRRQFDAGSKSNDAFDKDYLYSPRIDYAIGPFNLDQDRDVNVERINHAFNEHRPLIRKIVSEGLGNLEGMSYFNSNPRVFMAIEEENKTSRKHRLGGILNASALGKVGILVGASDEAYWSAFKIKRYLDYLRRYKSVVLALNVAVIPRPKFIEILEDFAP